MKTVTMVLTEDVQSDGEWVAPKKLLQSIRMSRIVCPLLIDDDYQIIDGRRRLACAIELGIEQVPVIIIPKQEVLTVLGLAANIHSSNPLSEARMLQDEGMDEQKDAIGLTAGQIRARRKLLSLSPCIQAALERGEISLSAAKELCKLPNHEAQEAAFRKVDGKPTLHAVRREVRRTLTSLNPQLPITLPSVQQGPACAIDGAAIAVRIREFVAENELGEDAVGVLLGAAEILERRCI